MSFDWSKLLEVKNIFPFIRKYFLFMLLLICLLGWSFFILPLVYFQTLQIENLRSKYFELIGAVTYVSTFFFCIGIFYKGYKLFEQKLTEKRENKNHEKLMRELTSVEKDILLKFRKINSRTATFSLYNGVVAGLVEKGILYKPDSLSNPMGEQDFNLYQWVYEYLQKYVLDKPGE